MNSPFRKSALEKLSSPDQLDKTLAITSPLSWLALAGAALIIVSVLVWSVAGTLLMTVTASGIVASPVATNAVYTDESGVVTALYVTPGMELHLGDPVLTLRTHGGASFTVYSDQVGSVAEVLAAEGQSITQSSEVIRISPAVGEKQVVVCYVPVAQAKKVQRGMQAHISLTSADSQTHGHMMGRVINIDARATSSDGMSRVIGSGNSLERTFTEKGAVCAVTCQLYPDPATASGYWFSSAKGQALLVTSGSICEAKIITEELPPITKFLSGLKEIWGD